MVGDVTLNQATMKSLKVQELLDLLSMIDPFFLGRALSPREELRRDLLLEEAKRRERR